MVFLVDRRELDKNTSSYFKGYAEYEAKDMVHETKTTSQLKVAIQKKNGIIITTTFKMHSLVKQLAEAKDFSLKEKHIIFIIDEAHRTTMGTMMKDIKEFFVKHGLFFGFTGTPLFDENNAAGLINQENEAIKTTRALFGPSLHEYKIDEAIRDQNVLAFHVDYLNTGEFKSYDDLKDELVDCLIAEQPDKSERDIERKVREMPDFAVEMECKKRQIILYQDETHIPAVVSMMLKEWEAQSQNRLFNAILTVGLISRAVAYWKEFQRQQEGKESPINVAVTFCFGNENDKENIAIKEAEGIFKAYEAFTGQRFSYGDKNRGEAAYFNDLIERAKNGGSWFSSKNIDLVIVADQLLTGYNSKYINTLYVDRNLELQGLIQAYSRTNRLYGREKEFGTIVNFMWPAISETNVNRALALYGSKNENSQSSAIVDIYDVAVKKLAEKFKEMVDTLASPSAWLSLKNNEDDKKAFFKAYRAASSQYARVKQYYEYNWDDARFGMDEDTWLKYVGAYRNLNENNEDDDPGVPIRDLKGKTKLVGHTEVTASYILNLLGKKISADGTNVFTDEESLRMILEQIQEYSDKGHAKQADMLKEFLNAVQSRAWPLGSNAELSFRDWRLEKLKDELAQFAGEWGLDQDILLKSATEYNPDAPDVVPRMDEIVDSINRASDDPFSMRLDLMQKLPDFLREQKMKYFD